MEEKMISYTVDVGGIEQTFYVSNERMKVAREIYDSDSLVRRYAKFSDRDLGSLHICAGDVKQADLIFEILKLPNYFAASRTLSFG